MSTERSPLNPHALTLDEVKKLQPGTRLVLFNLRTGYVGVMVLSRVNDECIYWHRASWMGNDGPPPETSNDLTDCGLKPMPNGSWNPLNFTIQLRDLGKMPAPPPRSSCIYPFEMQ